MSRVDGLLNRRTLLLMDVAMPTIPLKEIAVNDTFDFQFYYVANTLS
jgi:hypothetical protein